VGRRRGAVLDRERPLTSAEIKREKAALERAWVALYRKRAQAVAESVLKPAALLADEALTAVEVKQTLDAARAVKAQIADLTPAEERLLQTYIRRAVRLALAEQSKIDPSLLSAQPGTWPPGTEAAIVAAARREIAAQRDVLLKVSKAQAAEYETILRAARSKTIDRADALAALRERTGVALTYAQNEAIRAANATIATVTEIRQTAAGIDEYIWDANDDEVTRPLHREYDGKVFRWDSPPKDGHPGHAYGCRCSARPNIKTGSTFEASTFERKRDDLRGVPPQSVVDRIVKFA
jgi:SPP1 gp7 family putative phage head morphogenesis protein